MYSTLLFFLDAKKLNGGKEMTEDENVSTDDDLDEPSGKKRIKKKQFSKSFGELDILQLSSQKCEP